MPNLDFYAFGDDHPAVLDAVFDLGLFRVFEADSAPRSPVREFGSSIEVPDDPCGAHLMLYAVGSGPEPTARRIDVRHGDVGFRHECRGWGLVQLRLGILFRDEELRWSHTNHNTESRAARWTEALPELGDPGAWDWPAVTKASGRVNRAIRSLAVTKIGSHPVLPGAAACMESRGLEFEYGAGIHARQAPGLR